jgi:nitrate reductase NapD
LLVRPVRLLWDIDQMKLSRRDMVRGTWRGAESENTEVASVLVQTTPARLDAAEAAIREIAGAEVVQRDERGKLVVVLEPTATETIGANLTRLSLLPDVITATLVYHAHDTSQ